MECKKHTPVCLIFRVHAPQLSIKLVALQSMLGDSRDNNVSFCGGKGNLRVLLHDISFKFENFTSESVHRILLPVFDHNQLSVYLLSCAERSWYVG
jgi:hypothetical protein